jgi:hypothetical protein
MTERTRILRRRKRNYEGAPDAFLPRVVYHYHRKRRKIANQLITKHIEFVPSEAELGLRGRLLLGYFRRFSSHYKALPIVGYGAATQALGPVAEPTTATVTAPCAPGGTPQHCERASPDIEARILENALVAACSSAFVANGRIVVPDYYVDRADAVISDRRLLYWQGADRMGLILQSPGDSYEAGLSLFASGAYNWYHWLIEVLPAAFLSERLSPDLARVPLVIPAEIAELATFRESLELFRNGREVITLGPGTHHFDRLILIDGPVREPMNMRPGKWPSLDDYAFNPTVLEAYRNAIRDRLGVTAGRHDDRIFLARGHGRRAYNQDELLAIAERHGFRPVYPERLTFREQVETLTGAAFVIGPSGAAFANTLFCQPGTRLLSWLVPQYAGFCSYANIATVTGSELRYLFATPDRPIESSFDAFWAEYRIDPAEFEAALRMALDPAARY